MYIYAHVRTCSCSSHISIRTSQRTCLVSSNGIQGRMQNGQELMAKVATVMCSVLLTANKAEWNFFFFFFKKVKYHYGPVGSPKKPKIKQTKTNRKLFPLSTSLCRQPRSPSKAAHLKGWTCSQRLCAFCQQCRSHSLARTSARSGEEEGKIVEQKSCGCEIKVKNKGLNGRTDRQAVCTICIVELQN